MQHMGWECHKLGRACLPLVLEFNCKVRVRTWLDVKYAGQQE